MHKGLCSLLEPKLKPMQALPSIAFEGFSGSAKDVTARQVGSRTILSVRCWPTGPATNAQVARRVNFAKITKSYNKLSDSQMQEWNRLAKTESGQSVLGQKAELSGINLYVRLNANKVMAGEDISYDAPVSSESLPVVEYSDLIVTPTLIAFKGIPWQEDYIKLVVKMSAGQSPGTMRAWDKTVILSSSITPIQGVADVTVLYFKTLKVMPRKGEKVYVETYWLNTRTGRTGSTHYEVKTCVDDWEITIEDM